MTLGSPQSLARIPSWTSWTLGKIAVCGEVTIQVLRPDRIDAGRRLDQQWYPARDPGKCDDSHQMATMRDRASEASSRILGKFDIAGDVKLPKIETRTHHAGRSG
jgi:hypothetical protein